MEYGSQTAVAVGWHMGWKHNRAECCWCIEENLDLVVVDSWAW